MTAKTAKAANTDIFVAARGASVIFQGRRISVTRGKTTVRAGHPLLAQCAELFRPLTVEWDWPPGGPAPSTPPLATPAAPPRPAPAVAPKGAAEPPAA